MLELSFDSFHLSACRDNKKNHRLALDQRSVDGRTKYTKYSAKAVTSLSFALFLSLPHCSLFLSRFHWSLLTPPPPSLCLFELYSNETHVKELQGSPKT